MKTISQLMGALYFISFSFISAQDNQQLIVQFDENAEMSRVISNNRSYKKMRAKLLPIKQLSSTLNIWLLELQTSENIGEKNSRDMEKLVIEVNQYRGVKAVQYNQPVVLRAIPNDSLYSKQWQYQNNGHEQGVIDADIDAPEAWEITTGGKTAMGDEIVIAVIDGGIDLQHPDLKDNIWVNRDEIPNNHIDDDGNGYVDDIYGWNFNKNNNSVDNNGLGHWHGSPVSGIIGASGNNKIGVSGMNWSVKIMHLVANTTIADVISAYDYILNMRVRYNRTNGEEGAFIVATNTSLGINRGTPNDAPLWCAMYNALGSAGVLNVASTANDNIDVDIEGDLPTTCTSDYLISVTNTTATDNKEEFAAYGLKNIDLGAPGSGIFTIANQSTYDYFQGTSAAAPHVAGAVGLLYSANLPDFMQEVEQRPEETALLVKKCILRGTDTVQSLQNKSVTGGRLNLYAGLVELLRHYNVEPVPTKDNDEIKINAFYPNPTNNIVYLDFTVVESATNLTVEVFDALGRKTKQKEFGKINTGEHQIVLSMEDMAKGMYFIKINQTKAVKLLVY